MPRDTSVYLFTRETLHIDSDHLSFSALFVYCVFLNEVDHIKHLWLECRFLDTEIGGSNHGISMLCH